MIKVLELFAGIGACSKALERLGIEHEIVDAVEIDKYAIKSFNAIHGTNFEVQDITKWDKDVEVDLIMHGSPCQDFSVAGKQAGGDIGSGTRSSLMYETIRIVGKLRPKYVVWENVKNLLSKKHKHNFDAYIETMNILGYNSYYQVLNAKDYGIPQNRERVFTISIRKDIDKGNFEFPPKEELKLRLKDMLEDEVDGKYYLSETQIERIKTTTYNVGKTRIQEKDYCDTLCARDWKDPKCVQVDFVIGSTQKNAAINYNGICPTLTTAMGLGGGQIPMIPIKNATKKGYDEATEGDSINLSYPESTTRRGRVGHGVAQTLQCNDLLGVVESINKNAKHQQDLVQSEDDICRTIPAGTHGSTPHLLKTIVTCNDSIGVVEKEYERTPLTIGDNQIKIEDYPTIIQKCGDRGTNNYSKSNISYTIPSNAMSDRGQLLIQPNLRIRKLTPKECWRLMGFDDEDFEKAEKVNSNTQLYKQARK